MSPRPALIADGMVEAVQAANATDSSEERKYQRGVMIGYAYAANPELHDQFLEANTYPYAQPLTWVEARWKQHVLARTAVNTARFLWACGVLHGFKEGTSEASDAEECTMCERRILTDTDDEASHCRYHGWFCSHDCRVSICPPNRTPDGCWEA